MARSLHKVQKQISKKHGGKPTALHENSRHAQRLRQAGAREDKLARIATAAARSNQIYIDRVAYFQDALAESTAPLSESQLQNLVKEFIGRDDTELAELRAAQRPGRPRSKAEENIQNRIDNESKEFKAGFWVPDVTTEDGLEHLKRWGGSWGGLNTLKFCRVVKDGDIQKSSFPPKSLS
ncbi:translation machinery-associated protein 16 [Lithohypha guttulata]|nr:translation machinery-associated protein 16 [Lithohypha guttulata]